MESVPADLAKTGVEKLIDKIIAELRHICCYTCIVKGFEKEKKWLEAEWKTVEQRNQVVKGKGQHVPANTSLWTEEAAVIIKEDTKTNPTCFPGCINRYKRGRELANKAEEIKKLVSMGKTLENGGVAPRLPGVERYSSQYYISFKSRESKYNELLDALKDDNIYMIGLQGLGGTGKTTLARQVGKQLMQLKQFDHVIDTIVASSPNMKKIQDDIAAPLGLKWEDCTESERAGKLWSRLTNGEKILLIFDDVWDWRHVNFEEIGIPSTDNCKGCRVLVTTRDVRVCDKLGCERVTQLDMLSDEDAWIMFKSHVGITDGSSKSLIQKGHEIVKECKGLPIAIAVIARSLKGQRHQDEWGVALKSLQEPCVSMRNVDENSVEIYKCLMFSYNNMKDEKSKGLFLLFSVFPEDMQVPNEILIRFGIGAGIVGEVADKYDDTRMKVVLAVNRLMDSCLLLKGEEIFLTMHDLVREAAQWIANNEIQEVNLSNKNQKLLVERENKIKYLSCKGKCIDVFSCRIDGSKLEILNIFMEKCTDTSVQVPSSFFENMKRLRVLYIHAEGYGYFRTSCALPQSIQSLMNVRTLIFYTLQLGDISNLGNMQSLETLEFFDCEFIELPLEIAKLEKLRLLGLRYCRCINNPFEVIERCSSLEELYIDGIMEFFDYKTETTVHQLRTPLQRYLIYDDKKYDTYDCLSKQVSFIRQYSPFFPEEIVKFFVQTAEDLQLRGTTWKWVNLIPEIVPMDEGMNDLVYLHLICFPQLEHLIDSTNVVSQRQNVFSKLAKLKLEEMDSMKELCKGPFPSDFLKSLESMEMNICYHLESILFKENLNLCNLKRLILCNCPTLESLFLLSTARSLVLLEELQLVNCSQLKNIITSERVLKEKWGEEIVDCGNDSKSSCSMFPTLKVLYVIRCPELQVIFPFFSGGDVPVLKFIQILNCDKLSYIFGQCQHEHEGSALQQQVNDAILGSLNEMDLQELPNFIDIFPACDHPMCLSVKRSAAKHGSQAVVQSDLQKNKMVQSNISRSNIFPWRWRSITNTKIPLESMHQPQDSSISLASNSSCHQLQEPTPCLLKPLQIYHNIKSICLCYLSSTNFMFVLSIAQTMLESLEIRKCDELKGVIGGGINGGDVIFPKLKILEVIDCEQLEYIFGHYSDDHPNQKDIIHCFPALESLHLVNLSNFMSICSENYRVSLPHIEEFILNKCPKYSINSGACDFFDQLDSSYVKDQRGNEEYTLRLENVKVRKSNAQNIFCLHEMVGQQMYSQLGSINLQESPQMMNLFAGPKNCLILQVLKDITIVGCKKLETIFSTCVVRSLPQLRHLEVAECSKLKQIIEVEDAEDQKISKTCFPRLKRLVVRKCNKMKFVLPASLCKELPRLESLVIMGANELEEVFGGEGDRNVGLPRLDHVAFIKLPSFCQGNQFRTVDNCFVEDCPKLCLSLTTELDSSINDSHVDEFSDLPMGYMEAHDVHGVVYSSLENVIGSGDLDCHSRNNTPEITEDFPIETQVQVNSLQVNTDESIQQAQSCVNTLSESATKDVYGGDSKEAIEQTNDSEQIVATDVDVENSQENTETNEPEHSATDLDIKDSQVQNIETPELDQSANTNVDGEDSQEHTEIDEPGNPSIIMEDLSFGSLVSKELEQLVSKKFLASENLSLLVDFLVKHPNVRLAGNSLSSRNKGNAYCCLIELLQFLQTHSVLDVLGSSHDDFVDLLKDMRLFGFHKEWLDGVERCALFPDYKVSHDALQELLDSKHQLESSEAVLERITQQEAQVLEARAAFTAPLGY